MKKLKTPKKKAVANRARGERVVKKEREIKAEALKKFFEGAREINAALARLENRDFTRQEWLGGDQKENAYEAPPDDVLLVAQALGEARNALDRAEHLAVLAWAVRTRTRVLPCAECGRLTEIRDGIAIHEDATLDLHHGAIPIELDTTTHEEPVSRAGLSSCAGCGQEYDPRVNGDAMTCEVCYKRREGYAR